MAASIVCSPDFRESCPKLPCRDNGFVNLTAMSQMHEITFERSRLASAAPRRCAGEERTYGTENELLCHNLAAGFVVVRTEGRHGDAIQSAIFVSSCALHSVSAKSRLANYPPGAVPNPGYFPCVDSACVCHFFSRSLKISPVFFFVTDVCSNSFSIACCPRRL